MLSLVTRHGRTTPLVWLTVDKETLKDNRNRYEDQVLGWLAEALPPDIKILIVADRGFGDHKLYRMLTEELKFEYLIRFRGNIKVTAADGETRMAIDWVGQRGRTRILHGAAVTAHQRCCTSMPGDERQHDCCLVIGIEIRPVHGDLDAFPGAHCIRHPAGKQFRNLNPRVRRQPVYLFSRVLDNPPCAKASPRPMLQTAKGALVITPSVAFARE